MTRSVWKGPYVHPSILKKVDRALKDEKLRYKVIKIWSRSSSILPNFVGLKFGVYNGKKFIPIDVTENMVGKKFGEFSPTRAYHVFTSKDKGGKGRGKAGKK